jgi:hypothetical protein
MIRASFLTFALIVGYYAYQALMAFAALSVAIPSIR